MTYICVAARLCGIRYFEWPKINECKQAYLSQFNELNEHTHTSHRDYVIRNVYVPASHGSRGQKLKLNSVGCAMNSKA